MNRHSLARLILTGAIAALFCSCEDMQQMQQQAQQAISAVIPTPTPGGWWHDEGGSGEPKIVVHISEQKAYFFKGKHLVGESTVSTGKKG
jgi:hypothetical protein